MLPSLPRHGRGSIAAQGQHQREMMGLQRISPGLPMLPRDVEPRMAARAANAITLPHMADGSLEAGVNVNVTSACLHLRVRL
jgi:hypothetical protein